MRTSALLPVTDRVGSNWICNDRVASAFRVPEYWRANSTGESHAPRKSASMLTITLALSKR